MCINSCITYTGPYLHLQECPDCHQLRSEVVCQKNVPRAVFNTIPLGSQLQAMWCHPDTAQKMCYHVHHTQELFDELEQNEGFVNNYDDVFCGQAYLEAVQKGSIGPDDTLLMFSINGAQLFESKESDCWIYIWVILDLSPDYRYKKQFVLPDAIIPGPKKPRFVESFLFPGLYHLSALQWEGLHVWDAAQNRVFDSRLYFFLGCGDGPGLTTLSNFVGHSGKCSCRMLCSLTGW